MKLIPETALRCPELPSQLSMLWQALIPTATELEFIYDPDRGARVPTTGTKFGRSAWCVESDTISHVLVEIDGGRVVTFTLDSQYHTVRAELAVRLADPDRVSELAHSWANTSDEHTTLMRAETLQLTDDEAALVEPDDTIYFSAELPYAFLGNVRNVDPSLYGFGMNTVEYLIGMLAHILFYSVEKVLDYVGEDEAPITNADGIEFRYLALTAPQDSVEEAVEHVQKAFAEGQDK